MAVMRAMTDNTLLAALLSACNRARRNIAFIIAPELRQAAIEAQVAQEQLQGHVVAVEAAHQAAAAEAQALRQELLQEQAQSQAQVHDLEQQLHGFQAQVLALAQARADDQAVMQAEVQANAEVSPRSLDHWSNSGKVERREWGMVPWLQRALAHWWRLVLVKRRKFC